jgi:dolichol-phosphate mannosyltransferase
VHYDRDPRAAGSTKYPFSKMASFALDAIVSFSFVPLRIAAAVGFAVSALTLIALPGMLVLSLAGTEISGVAILVDAVLLLGGIQLATIGILGEYVGRAYEETKRRPIYVVQEVIASPERARVGSEVDGLSELIGTGPVPRFRT